MVEHRHPANRLANETSPYLLQHAHNPVDWRPWNDEAFAEARRLDRPIFLSVGYSTCHWCHVMEHESFENEGIARILNDNFVPVKVDREERPDIDAIYMDALQSQTGSGGWPMSVFIDFDRNPFYCATYIPPTPRYGRPGFPELLAAIAEAWVNRRGEVLEHASAVTAALRANTRPRAEQTVDLSVCDLAFEQLSRTYDVEAGGWGGRNKFPTPHRLLFLLRYHARLAKCDGVKSAAAASLAVSTLRSMLAGGIRDHVGGGFHRYSTDAHWHLPHFEKMLYDQAQMALALIEAFQATSDPALADGARDLFAYVLRDLHDTEGGFWSAEDADSLDPDGKLVEGLFYVWSQEEAKEVLGERDGALIARLFGFADGGNFHDEATGHKLGLNILHLRAAAELSPEDQLLTERNRFRATVVPMLARLAERRASRVRPRLDDKVLTSWNGLMLSAFATGGRVLLEPEYLDAAKRCANFALDRMRDGKGELRHSARKGKVAIGGMLPDYAFLARGLLDLYAATFEVEWLAAAQDLTRRMLARFEDREHGGFFFNCEGQNDLIVRRKDAYDGAEPSGNSVAAEVLARLSRLTGESEFATAAARTFAAFGAELSGAPSNLTHMLLGLEAVSGVEVVVVARNLEHARPLLDALNHGYRPERETLLLTEANRRQLEALAPFVRGYRMIDGQATAYVCRKSACSAPVTDIGAMLELLDST